MSNIQLATSFSFSLRVYRSLLVAYPKKFREQYETQMVQVFRDSIREAHHQNGIPGVVDLWIHTIFDLVFTSLNEHMVERSRYMFSPKLVLWGGIASVFAGLFWLMTGLAPNSGPSTQLALVLGLGGLISMYTQQQGQGGRLALAGFALGITSTVLMLVADWIGPASDEAGGMLILLLGFLTLGIGLALLGIANMHEKTLPRWRGLPLTLGLLNIMLGTSL